MVVKINRCAFRIGFGHNPDAVLLMANLLSTGENLHVFLLNESCFQSTRGKAFHSGSARLSAWAAEKCANTLVSYLVFWHAVKNTSGRFLARNKSCKFLSSQHI